MKNQNPLAHQHDIRSLLRFAAPSIGMMLMISLYTVTDGIFIGRYAGSEALAASNIVYPAINLVLGLAIMLAAGGSALVARTLGEGNSRLASQRFTLIVCTAAVLSTVLALLLAIFMTPVLGFLGASPLLYEDCVRYLGVLLPFYPAAALMMVFNAFFIADGKPMQGFLISLVSGVVNATLDYVFLAHMGWGVLGAGLATGIADLIAASTGLIYFTRYGRQLRFTRPRLELAALGKTITNGCSELVTETSVGITTFLFNIATFAWAGEDGVAAISIILYAEMLLTAILIGFSNGIAPIFSYQFGARQYKELLRLMKLSLLCLTAFSLAAFAGSRLLAEPLIGLFLPEGGHVADLTINGFLIFSLSFLFVGFNTFTSGFFTAISDGRTSAIASFTRNLAGIVIFLTILPRFFGFNGVWLAVPAADLTALFLSAFLLYDQRNAFIDKRRKQQLARLRQPVHIKY